MARIIKSIHAQECREVAMTKVADIRETLREMKLPKAAELIKNKIEETLSYCGFSDNPWVRIRINNTSERIIREIRLRTRVVGAFPIATLH